MTPSNRYLAVKVASDQPLRYRLIRQARHDERTDSSIVPQHLVLVVSNPVNWSPLVTLGSGGLTSQLIVDKHGIQVEQPEQL